MRFSYIIRSDDYDDTLFSSQEQLEKSYHFPTIVEKLYDFCFPIFYFLIKSGAGARFERMAVWIASDVAGMRGVRSCAISASERMSSVIIFFVAAGSLFFSFEGCVCAMCA